MRVCVCVSLKQKRMAGRQTTAVVVQDGGDDGAADAAGSTSLNASITGLRSTRPVPLQDRTRGLHAVPELTPSETEGLALLENYHVFVSDPAESDYAAAPPVRWLPLYGVFCLIHVQLTLAILYAISVILLIVQGFGVRRSFYSFPLLCMLFYVLEGVVLFLYRSPQRAPPPCVAWWKSQYLTLCVVVVIEFVAWVVWSIEEVKHDRSVSLILLAWLRLLLWAYHGRLRWEQLQQAVRTTCSADRRRYRGEGFDLDYAYIHHNIAAMAWPSHNFERLFRNTIEQVTQYLDWKHPDSYLVVNLCSERTYAPELFHGHTSWYPMDDHNPAELEMMVAFCREITDFVAVDPQRRVAAVHCKGGKGRTGAMICAYLMFTGLQRTADRALYHFAHLRTKYGARSFQGVQAPSQDRYVRYFEKLLQQPQLSIPRRPVRVRALRLHHIPWLWYSGGVGKLWFVILTKPCTERTVCYLSNPSVTFDSKVPDPSTYTAKQIRDLFGTAEDNLYKECNEVDPALLNSNSVTINPTNAEPTATTASPNAQTHLRTPHGYDLDVNSFWYYLDAEEQQRLSYTEFQQRLVQLRESGAPPSSGGGGGGSWRASKLSPAPQLTVGVELREPAALPVLDGDVVFKFYYAKNNPNPLEPPVQFWLHTAFEPAGMVRLGRDQLDGPAKDTKATRYPEGFAISIELEDALDAR